MGDTEVWALEVQFGMHGLRCTAAALLPAAPPPRNRSRNLPATCLPVASRPQCFNGLVDRLGKTKPPYGFVEGESIWLRAILTGSTSYKCLEWKDFKQIHHFPSKIFHLPPGRRLIAACASLPPAQWFAHFIPCG